MSSGNIRVANSKGYILGPNEIAITVDRRTPLGNPFALMKDTVQQRMHVCSLYEDEFLKPILTMSIMDFIAFAERRDIFGETIITKLRTYVTVTKYMADIVLLLRTKNVVLLCHCVPKQCHAQAIKKYALEMFENESSHKKT